MARMLKHQDRLSPEVRPKLQAALPGLPEDLVHEMMEPPKRLGLRAGRSRDGEIDVIDRSMHSTVGNLSKVSGLTRVAGRWRSTTLENVEPLLVSLWRSGSIGSLGLRAGRSRDGEIDVIDRTMHSTVGNLSNVSGLTRVAGRCQGG
ncbi:hypothetical protein RJ639_027886 [Escallonia herrerae]|uniref:Uncharacterized protein n=1 Tax=Escallonia herrerae TaxID=1293975 RepID=A0AA89BR13_9ASTE|nr:hypothetical protein RJ639_027886 [Escallonia herrerae]